MVFSRCLGLYHAAMRVRWGITMKFNGRCLSRNCPSVFYDNKNLSIGYCRIYGNKKPRNNHAMYFLGVRSIPRFFVKHGFVCAQNRAYSRLRL